ncbi:MAG: dipeptidase [Parachlamydiales bacterium]|jgi:acetylornithine deacetylase/succinyl-diaminopimelate desuccinylase-like protein
MQTTLTPLAKYKEFFENNRRQLIDEYFDFLKIPSISSEAAYTENVKQGADWVAHYLRSIGFDVDVWKTTGHPTVFAQNLEAGTDKPTLLIYNHYDVQPVDPLDLWKSSPFEPALRGNEVYARGAQDNKGQCFYTMAALKALRMIHGKFPINIKLVVEGEEECGSQGLTGILSEKKKELVAEYLAVVDMGLPAKDIPAVTLGIRGIMTMDVTVTGSSTDLHSGSHGGIVYNPNRALAEILASLYNDDGSVAVPGYYDSVRELKKDTLDNLYMDFDEKHYLEAFGALPTGGEKKFLPVHRACLRPTVEINGMWGGYTGDGFKTVIPAKAHAKISCRLVADMDPQNSAKSVADYLISKAPPGIKVEVHIHQGGGKAVQANPNSPVVKAFSDAYTEIFEKKCSYVFEGGSIPVITALAEASKSAVVLLGMGLADDGIHAPNEHFGLDRLEKGFLIIARSIELLGQR